MLCCHGYSNAWISILVVVFHWFFLYVQCTPLHTKNVLLLYLVSNFTLFPYFM